MGSGAVEVRRGGAMKSRILTIVAGLFVALAVQAAGATAVATSTSGASLSGAWQEEQGEKPVVTSGHFV